MKKILDSFSWGFLTVFLFPCLLVVASWTSLPGDSLFAVKLGLERTLVYIAFPSYGAQGSLEVRYTEKRFDESKKLLAEYGSTQGLAYLRSQVLSTKDFVLKAPKSASRRTVARSYVATLGTVSKELQTERQSLASSADSVSSVSQAEAQEIDDTITAVDDTISDLVGGGMLDSMLRGGPSKIIPTEEDTARPTSIPTVIAPTPITSEADKEKQKESFSDIMP